MHMLYNFFKAFYDFLTLSADLWSWLVTPNASLFDIAPLYLILGVGVLVGIVRALVGII